MRLPFGRRTNATLLHLLGSVGVSALAALLVFFVWYPGPYSLISGGLALFGLLVGVDVLAGPLLTAVVASPDKPLAELRRDVCVIVVLQLAAMIYGLHTMAAARPVSVVFEIDRFRVVTAVDLQDAPLDEAPPGLRELSWTGPRLTAAVRPTDPAEQLRSIELGLAGFDLAVQPRFWRSYESQKPLAWKASRPAVALTARYPEAAAEVARIAAAAGQPVDALRFLPMLSQRSSGVALLAPGGDTIVGYLPLEGFF